MSDVIYTAEAHVTGGRAEGHGRTSDGVLQVDLRAPVEMGGQGGGANPEQLFAVGYAACFESALGIVARRRRLEAGDVSIDARVSLLPTADRAFKLAVALAVTLPSVRDPEAAAEVVRAAHQVCPYSNATRGNIDVALSVNGRAVDAAAAKPADRMTTGGVVNDTPIWLVDETVSSAADSSGGRAMVARGSE